MNDSLGHTVGDQVLQHIASKLTTNQFKQGHACRFGGDEFVWVVDKAKLNEPIDQVANILIQLMNEPFRDANNEPVIISASVGIANYPEDGNNFEELILKADAAMYLAKKQGKHCWVNYIAGMENTLQRQSELAQFLYKALENNEFELYYQPIFDVEKKQIFALEALLRWNNPNIRPCCY